MKKELNIVGNRKIFLGISAAILVIGIVCNIFMGVQLDVSFKGGTLLKYSYTGTMDESKAIDVIAEKLDHVDPQDIDSTLSMSGDVNILNISLVEEITLDDQQAIDQVMSETFKDNNIKLINSNSLDPVMGQKFFIKCLVAIALASAFLLIYVALRFRKIGGWSAAVMALLALLNDILVAYFTFVIFRIPLNDNFVAVILTILGYSLNDTIVIFDRIRENRRLMDSKTPIGVMVNTSINQSLLRSFNTSLCTFVAVAVMTILALITGMDSIISFTLPMLFGILSGFYTSTFLCCPMWSAWIERKERKAKEKKGSKKARA